MPDKEILRGFADNEALMNAVKELLLSQFSLDNLKLTEDDILLGQMVRARLVGLKAIEAAWTEILSHKSYPPTIDKKNPAR